MAFSETPLPETIPDSQPTVAEQLEKQIETLRAQVNDLASHKANLTSTLLSLPMSQKALTGVRRPWSPDREGELERYKAMVSKQSEESMTSIYRLGIGITLFECKDPNPSAVDAGQVTGIRMESFDLVQSLAIQYLSKERTGSEGEETHVQAEKEGLNLFARAVRKKAMYLNFRRHAVDRLKSRLNEDRIQLDTNGQSRKWVKDVMANDAGYLSFRIEWLGGHWYDIDLDETGVVQSVKHGAGQRSHRANMPTSFEGDPGVWHGRWEVGMPVDALGEYSAEGTEAMEDHRRSTRGSVESLNGLESEQSSDEHHMDI